MKTFLYLTIQFSHLFVQCLDLSNSSVRPIDRILSVATTSGQSGPGSYGYEEALRIPQRSSNTGTSPSDCLVSYTGHSFGRCYSSAEVQSVYFTVSSRLGYWGMSYSSAEVQSVYSTALAD